MQFLMMVKSPDGAEMKPPSAEQLSAMEDFCIAMAKAGVLKLTGGLLPPAQGARLRAANGRIALMDGPFTEAKEVVGGFAIIEVSSLNEAIELGKRFLAVAGDADLEIRQMMAAPAHNHLRDCA
jgi:hypothetical protein